MGAGGIDFGGIGTVITALTGVLLTLGTVLTSRQRHSQINAGAAMEEAAQRALQYQATARHVGYLESIISELPGGVVPPRPTEMSAAWWAKAIGLDTKPEAQKQQAQQPAAPDGAPAAPPGEGSDGHPKRPRHGRHGAP